MMMKNVVITTVLATTLLTGCAGTYNKATTGAALGALTGTALAYGLAKDSGKKNLWLIAGAAAGGLAGNAIGAALDERDKLLLGQTFQHTMETAPTNQQGSWNNPDSGNSGSVTPTATHLSANEQPCREFTTTVNIGGQPQQGYGTACRQADGSWKIQQG
jgi:surface antigen